jgi:hypothetical protein
MAGIEFGESFLQKQSLESNRPGVSPNNIPKKNFLMEATLSLKRKLFTYKCLFTACFFVREINGYASFNL